MENFKQLIGDILTFNMESVISDGNTYSMLKDDTWKYWGEPHAKTIGYAAIELMSLSEEIRTKQIERIKSILSDLKIIIDGELFSCDNKKEEVICRHDSFMNYCIDRCLTINDEGGAFISADLIVD